VENLTGKNVYATSRLFARIQNSDWWKMPGFFTSHGF
jgi:hypothetical protein